MLLKNNKARLITINGPMRGDRRQVSYQIKPGNNPAVEVPDELCKTAFVKSLVADESLIVMSATPVVADEPEPSAYDAMSKADLVALCEAQDIEVGARDTKADLIVKLEASDAGE